MSRNIQCRCKYVLIFSQYDCVIIFSEVIKKAYKNKVVALHHYPLNFWIFRYLYKQPNHGYPDSVDTPNLKIS